MLLLNLCICGSRKATLHPQFQGSMGGWVDGWVGGRMEILVSGFVAFPDHNDGLKDGYAA